MKVLQLRCALHCVVEVRFQSATPQEAVGHLRQVNPNYGIWIPKRWKTLHQHYTSINRDGSHGRTNEPHELTTFFLIDCMVGRSADQTLNTAQTENMQRSIQCTFAYVLPQFGMVGMGQHLTSHLCVVFTEKTGTFQNNYYLLWRCRHAWLLFAGLITWCCLTVCHIMGCVIEGEAQKNPTGSPQTNI